MSDIILERVKSSDARYKAIRGAHYVADNGTVGRAIHYVIHYGNQVAGIISGASSTWNAAKHDPLLGFFLARQFDEFFAEEHEGQKPLDQELLVTIINNSVFRLTYNEHGLASRVLAAWRDQVQDDWMMRYGGMQCGYDEIPVFAFETFIEPREHGNGKRRDGGCYRFDGWKHTGTTAAGKLRYVRKNERFLEWLHSEECLVPWSVGELLEEMYKFGER